MEKGVILKCQFPSDLWPEVLSCLPVKSLLRFRCVCRSWLALIDDSDFARSHLTRFNSNRHETHLFTVQAFGTMIKECVVRCSKTLEITSRLAILTTGIPSSDAHTTTIPAYNGVDGWEVVSSVDGLLMLRNTAFLVDDQVLFMMWNPSVRKFRSVPTLPEFVISEDMEALEWCLGFDPVNNDYKYVRVVQTDLLKFVAVYSVGMNSWKKIALGGGEGGSRWRQYFNYYVQGICFRGVLYAMNPIADAALELVFFDLSRETLDSTILPDELKIKDPNTYHVLTIADGGSSLAMVKFTKNTGSLWVCQGTEGDNKFLSWTERYTFTCKMPEFCKLDWIRPCLLYLKKNGEMLIDWARMVSSYHLETQEEKILLHNSLYEGSYWAYTESLMLLK